MPKTRTPKADYPSLDDFEPYREPAEKLAELNRKKAELEVEERRLDVEVAGLGFRRRSREPKLDLDAIAGVLAGDAPPSNKIEATQLDLKNTREKLFFVRRAIEQLRVELERVTNAASNELLPPMAQEYLKKRRRVVFAVCEISEANEDLWKVGDRLTNLGFSWQHILRPGRMFRWTSANLRTSVSAASKFLIEEVRDGIVAVEDVEKFVRSPTLMEQLRQAEKEHKRLEKTA